ncbi:winged helix-turn-helix transcriptional regulator [Actinoplanes italicus]|uniref:winged helix-turn-helix transcriptional regulator n=1 Tax=Actinoplanes italicus TaxID=113567 RepID=UPI001EF28101|nr:winged helix-turn-helix transcriptional regulator [Actinoplanes italicus]
MPASRARSDSEARVGSEPTWVLVAQMSNRGRRRRSEEDGLVSREVYAEVPPKAEYSLTADGISLNAALESLGAWGTERIRRIGAEKIAV